MDLLHILVKCLNLATAVNKAKSLINTSKAADWFSAQMKTSKTWMATNRAVTLFYVNRSRGHTHAHDSVVHFHKPPQTPQPLTCIYSAIMSSIVYRTFCGGNYQGMIPYHSTRGCVNSDDCHKGRRQWGDNFQYQETRYTAQGDVMDLIKSFDSNNLKNGTFTSGESGVSLQLST